MLAANSALQFHVETDIDRSAVYPNMMAALHIVSTRQPWHQVCAKYWLG
jgi:hypothetical protein